MLKKILKITGIGLAVLLLILLIAPFLFKGKIVSIVKQQMNAHLTAKVDFNDLDLSFFRHFPRVSVRITDLQVTGTGVFAGDTLAAIKDIDVALNLMSVVKGSDFQIHSITVDQPRVHLIVTKDGQANYLITKPDTAANTGGGGVGTPFRLKLQGYTLNDGYLSYDDDGGNIHTTIAHLNHSGSGDLTADLFTLSTDTKAANVSFSYGGVPYLNDNAVAIGADIQVDAKKMKFTFKTDKITVNALQLSSEGSFQLVNDSTYAMDIRFNMPSADFKNLLSLVPELYQKDFRTIKTSGQAAFSGSVTGTYSPRQIPAYHINMDVKDGFFQYPDLPQAVRNINLQLQVDNPDGVTDHTVVDLRQGHLEMAGAPFDCRLLLKNPMTSRYIDAAAKGRLDLSKLTQFVKLEAGTVLRGVIDADVQAKGSVTAAQKQQLEGFNAAGEIRVGGFNYRSTAYPDGLEIHNAVFSFNPKNVTLSDMSGKIRETNFTAAGSLDNVLGYALKSGVLAGSLSVKADRVDLNKWMDTASGGGRGGAGGAGRVASGSDGAKGDGAGGDGSGRSGGDDADRSGGAKGDDADRSGGAKGDDAELSRGAKGDDADRSRGANGVQIASTGVFLVPANIDLTLTAAVDLLHYDKTDYRTVTGVLLVKDETVTMKDVRMQALGGTIVLNGSYSTRDNKKNPAISLGYDVQRVDVQQVFNAFNSVRLLMPAGKFISGTLSSSLAMKGNLGQDLTPQLNSLTGGGNLEILQGVVGNFPPLEKIASTLNVSQLKDLALKDIRNSFEFANGKVLVKPFDIKLGAIDMQIGGMHGIDQSIDYAINMKLPRSLMGSQGNALVNNLVSQASAKGVPLTLGETVNLDLKLGGTLTNPVLKTDLKGAAGTMADQLKQQALSFAQAKADSAKRAVKDTVASLKNQAIGAAKDELARRIAGGGGDTVKPTQPAEVGKRAVDAGKGLLKGLFNRKKDSVKL